MADAPDSKSGRGNPVGVQVPPPAPRKIDDLVTCSQSHLGSKLRETVYPVVGAYLAKHHKS